MSKIDFVIIWVDGSDKKWLKEKDKYSPTKIGIENAANRFRDWDTLKYLFRGIEKYAPWVNNIYFVTWGHLPKWMDTTNPKLKIINHKDYIPEKYLPTFSSHTIELNLHRIKGLSENFVYFNDDMLIINPVKKEDYFKNGIPCSEFYETVHFSYLYSKFSKICYNNVAILNEIFDKKEFYKKNFTKIFSPKNGFRHLVQNTLLFPFQIFCGMGVVHGSSSMMKKNYEYLWKEYYESFDTTCSHKFRNYDVDINQYVIKDYQNLTGKYYPRSHNFIKLVNVESKEQLPIIKKSLFGKKNKELCINDGLEDETKCEEIIKEVQIMLSKKFPDKCSFEK